MNTSVQIRQIIVDKGSNGEGYSVKPNQLLPPFIHQLSASAFGIKGTRLKAI
jgi:hypothetical protein